MGNWTRLVEFGAVSLALAVLARIAGRFGFSAVPLFLLGGLAFGRGGLLPLGASERFIEFSAEVGLLLLLLMLGLEYSAQELIRTLRSSAPSGVVNAVLNFTPGFLAGVLLGWEPLAAAFLGGVTYVSSSGIASKLISELRWSGNPEIPVVLSLLVMEDLSMLVFLPVVGVLAAGTSLGATVVAFSVAGVVVTTVFWLALRHSTVISALLFSRSDESLLLGIVGLMLLVGGIFEGAKISAPVGAFFVGIALSGPAADRARVILQPLRDLFAAIFFVFFGLQVDPHLLPPAVGPALALAAVSGGTKFASAWWSARRAGVDPPGRLRAGTLLVARGEFSIAIAGIAVAAGLEPRLGPLTAAYVLTLAVLGPISVRIAEIKAPLSR